MNVCWSSTRSASCSAVEPRRSRSHRGGAPRAIATRSSSAVSVHASPSTSTDSGRGRMNGERGHDRAGVLVDPGGQLVVEEAAGIELGAGTVDSGTYVDRHGHHARPSRRSAATTPGSRARSRPAGGIGPPGLPGHARRQLARRGERRRLGERGRPDEVERVEQVARVRVAVGERAEVPLGLDELQDRRVVVHAGARRSCVFANGDTMTVGTRKP